MPFFLIKLPPHCCRAVAARSVCLQPSPPLHFSSALLSSLSCHLLAAEGGGRENTHRGRWLIFRSAGARRWEHSAALASSSTSPPKVRGRKPHRGCLGSAPGGLGCVWGAGHAPLCPTNRGCTQHTAEEGTAAAGLRVTPSSGGGQD